MSESITQSDVNAIFELVPGAKDALQGMDISNLSPLWDWAWEAETSCDPGYGFTTVDRVEVQKRVANAVRVLYYGEQVS